MRLTIQFVFFNLSVMLMFTCCFASVDNEEKGVPQRVRDLMWIWGNPEMTQPGANTLSSFAQASPASRAKLLGLSNVVMGGFGLPHDDVQARVQTVDVCNSTCLVWKINSDGEPVGASETGEAPFVYRETMARVRGLADANPHLQAVLLDDVSLYGLSLGFNAQFIHDIRSYLPGKYQRIKIWGVIHSEQIDSFIKARKKNDYGLTEIIDALDVIVLSQWHAKEILNLEKHVARCEYLFPGKSIILQIYLYDYGGHKPMPLALLEKQCGTALKFLHSGRIKGILFSGTINDPQALKPLGWLANWIKCVGDQQLGSLQMPKQDSELFTADFKSSSDFLKIDKIYFMFHPAIWAGKMHGSTPRPGTPNVKDFLVTYAREVSVTLQQKLFMSRMKPNELLVLFPPGVTKPTRLIEQYATKVLGRRCIIINSNPPGMPASWRNLPNLIERFVNNEPPLEGKDAWTNGLPTDVKKELETDVRQACTKWGYEWYSDAIEVAYTTRRFALEIESELDSRRLIIDPVGTSSEAFGESFEQCAMTWKSMLPHFLGLVRGAPNIYDLSVSGSRFLDTAEFKERIELAHEIYLYLWQGADGRPIALYARAQSLLGDPQYYVDISLEAMDLEIWCIGNYGSKLYPSKGTSLKPENGYLKLPIFGATRRGGDDGVFYLIGANISFAEFRKLLCGSLISCN